MFRMAFHEYGTMLDAQTLPRRLAATILPTPPPRITTVFDGMMFLRYTAWRSRRAAPAIADVALMTSSRVVQRPVESLIVARAQSSGTPIARSTWEI